MSIRDKIYDKLRSLEYHLLWKISEWAINRSESRFHLSPAVKYRNQGYVEACDFVAENLSHFSWGHPEITMKDAANWVKEEGKSWEPEE